MRTGVTKPHRHILGVATAEAAIAGGRHLAPVVDVVLLEKSRGPVICLTAYPDRVLDRLRGVLLEQHEMPELGLQRTPRKRKPEPEHSVRENAVVAQLDMACAERA